MIKSPPFDILLRTDRFVIRTLMPEDASVGLENWLLDPLAAEMLNSPLRIWTVENQQDYFKSYYGQATKLLLGVFTKQDNTCIGLYIAKPNVDSGTFTVSMVIGDLVWRGKDAAREVSSEIERYFFNDLGFWKVKANVRPQNKAMNWVLLTNGWKKEARLVGHLLIEDEKTRGDLLVYGLLASEWRVWIANRDAKKLATLKL